MEYFVIGEREIVLGFMLVGVPGSAVSNREEALDIFMDITGQSNKLNRTMASSRPKVLILTEDVSDMLSHEVEAHQMTGKAPLVVEIPGLGGHLEGRKTLTQSIREAVGIQV
ncbi:MAG: V-type ATP synthase subunit F [Treponema sp.]|nr:V-type ATP synthase subunit F [Treponema sp.]